MPAGTTVLAAPMGVAIPVRVAVPFCVNVPVVVLFSRPEGSLPAAVPVEVCPGESPTCGLVLFTNGESGPNDAASVVGPIVAWFVWLVDWLRSVSLGTVVPGIVAAFDVLEDETELDDVDVVVDGVADVEDVEVDGAIEGAGVVTTGAGDAAAVPGAEDAMGAAACTAVAASPKRVAVRYWTGDGLRMARLLSIVS